jgi:glycosyltransferase involved in cell wall biosynthesis
MRALFVTHAFPRSETDPVGSFVLRLAVALQAHGIAVEVLTPSAPGLPGRGTFEGVAVERYRYAPRSLETLAYSGTMGQQVRQSWRARAALLAMLARAATRVVKRARAGQFDIVHAHWWFPSGLAASFARYAQGRPLVTTLHGSDVRFAREFPGGRLAFKRVVHASSALTTVSSWLAREALEIAPEARPIVAPMPVAPALFHPGGERDPERLLFVGKLTEQKGLQHLLRALRIMKSKPTVDVVGAGRVDDSHLRSLADELQLSPRVNWLPLLPQSELAPLYRRAALHVIPATDEGLGLTAIESLMSETPVVAFESGGVPDIVVPGTSGALVPPGDIEALAREIDRLLQSPLERSALGHKGREFALSRFSPDAVAARYASLYEQVVTRRST